jgi:hypothetical protein
MKILFLDIDSVMTVWDYTKTDPEPNKEFEIVSFEELTEKIDEELTKNTSISHRDMRYLIWMLREKFLNKKIVE